MKHRSLLTVAIASTLMLGGCDN
ncbi:MAG: hypothetical protein H6R26_650, partial [Proteobacteria bacterium]|nr:hypothetical protein [Pseudomonadota bacterium]